MCRLHDWLRFSVNTLRDDHLYCVCCAQIDDDGILQRLFESLLPSEIEEILEQPLPVADEDDAQTQFVRDEVFKSLEKSVGYNRHPPKLSKIKYRTNGICGLWHSYRMWAFVDWLQHTQDLADDHDLNKTQRKLETIFILACFTTRYNVPLWGLVDWFEARRIGSQQAYDVIQDLLKHYRTPIDLHNTVHFPASIPEYIDEIDYPIVSTGALLRVCNKFRRKVGGYLERVFADDDQTVRVFKACRHFNIDIVARLIEEDPDLPTAAGMHDALDSLPFAWRYYEGQEEKLRQLEAEWGEYHADPFVLNIDFDAADKSTNGERCLAYWRSKESVWPLLAKIAIACLMLVIASSDVERMFSIWTLFMGRLDAINLSVDNNQARAFMLSNR